MNELINKDSEWIIHFMGSLDRLLDSFEHLTANYRPTLNGEHFFTDKEVEARLSEPPDTSGLPERRAHSLYPIRR